MVCEPSNPNGPLSLSGVHRVLAAVGIGAQHLTTNQTQHGCLTIIPVVGIHHSVAAPVWGEGGRGGEGGGGERSGYKFFSKAICQVDMLSKYANISAVQK